MRRHEYLYMEVFGFEIQTSMFQGESDRHKLSLMVSIVSLKSEIMWRIY